MLPVCAAVRLALRPAPAHRAQSRTADDFSRVQTVGVEWRPLPSSPFAFTRSGKRERERERKSNINSGGKFLFQEKRRREKEGSTPLVEVGSGEERLKKQQERKEKGKRTNWSILEEA